MLHSAAELHSLHYQKISAKFAQLVQASTYRYPFQASTLEGIGHSGFVRNSFSGSIGITLKSLLAEAPEIFRCALDEGFLKKL